ncbi:hypothetical protein AVEN_184205-1 [Araneus ventricosus]|uniref:Uncharacterized protein n=1 Tax=Araneus ventricosus TaxID=182803 RepID=A0A4Y2IPQ0_ARAVE|nr:hypothetical protein AVEN_184205-1 [Araneus ventricosus]
MSTGRLISGGQFSLRMSPDLASKAIVGVIWIQFGEKPGTRYRPSNIRERDAYGGGSVCVWGGILLGGRTEIRVFPRGTVNAQAYRYDILDAYVRPYTGAIGDDILLQYDNDRTGLESWMIIFSRKQFSTWSGQLDHRT